MGLDRVGALPHSIAHLVRLHLDHLTAMYFR